MGTLVALRRQTSDAPQPEPGQKGCGVQGKGFPRRLMPWRHHGAANRRTLNRADGTIQVLKIIYVTDSMFLDMSRWVAAGL